MMVIGRSKSSSNSFAQERQAERIGLAVGDALRDRARRAADTALAYRSVGFVSLAKGGVLGLVEGSYIQYV